MNFKRSGVKASSALPDDLDIDAFIDLSQDALQAHGPYSRKVRPLERFAQSHDDPEFLRVWRQKKQLYEKWRQGEGSGGALSRAGWLLQRSLHEGQGLDTIAVVLLALVLGILLWRECESCWQDSEEPGGASAVFHEAPEVVISPSDEPEIRVDEDKLAQAVAARTEEQIDAAVNRSLKDVLLSDAFLAKIAHALKNPPQPAEAEGEPAAAAPDGEP
jgi:hypothetical protein